MAHHGNEGTVKVATDAIAEVMDWSYEETVDLAEKTAMGDTNKTYLPGHVDGGGSISCNWDETDTNGQGALTIGASVTLNLYPEGAATGDSYYTGTALVESVSHEGAKDDIVKSTFSFKGVLALTVVS